MKIHYENNTPFLTISSITRTIEVSHWGNIAVEETIDLRHTGATLKGPFSRYDYQRQSDSGISSVKSFKVCCSTCKPLWLGKPLTYFYSLGDNCVDYYCSFLTDYPSRLGPRCLLQG